MGRPSQRTELVIDVDVIKPAERDALKAICRFPDSSICVSVPQASLCCRCRVIKMTSRIQPIAWKLHVLLVSVHICVFL
jgi:hypothetical protein